LSNVIRPLPLASSNSEANGRVYACMLPSERDHRLPCPHRRWWSSACGGCWRVDAMPIEQAFDKNAASARALGVSRSFDQRWGATPCTKEQTFHLDYSCLYVPMHGSYTFLWTVVPSL